VRRTPMVLTVAMLLVAASVETVCAEVFMLKNGGRVEGELLNPKQAPRTTFVVRTTSGAEVTLDAAEVERKLHQTDTETEYEKVRPGFPDTVDGQWALAEWCLARNLATQRKAHLERILELDPKHVDAHRALNHRQVSGQWVSRDEEMTKLGYRRYRGRWRSAQEIELMERKAKDETNVREWYGKVKMWRGWLGTNRDGQAHKNLMAIDDPYAVEALAAGMKQEPVQAVRAMYIEILAKIGSPDAIQALAERSMEDPVLEVRLTCLDFLKKEKRPGVVSYYVGKLRSKDNLMVRRAAVGLSHMNDPSAVEPLINALVTTHTFKNTAPQGQMSQSFGTGPGGSGGPGGFSFGGGPKTIKKDIANPEVLDALVSITGQNYQFNVAAWKSWYAQQKKQMAIDARRT
jgi:hypothetical protein